MHRLAFLSILLASGAAHADPVASVESPAASSPGSADVGEKAAAASAASTTTFASLTGDDGKVAVTFTADGDRRVDVSIHRGEVGGFWAYNQLCTTPCTVRVTRGRSFFKVADPDAGIAGSGAFLLDQPSTVAMHRKSHRTLRRTLFVTGALMTAASIGAIFAAHDERWALATGVSGTVMLLPLAFDDELTMTQR